MYLRFLQSLRGFGLNLGLLHFVLTVVKWLFGEGMFLSEYFTDMQHAALFLWAVYVSLWMTKICMESEFREKEKKERSVRIRQE